MSLNNFDLTLKSVIYQTPIPTVIYINEQIYDCNDAFLELFEVDSKELILGKSPYEIFCSGNNHLNGTRYDSNIKGSKVKKLEFKAKTFKGKTIFVVIHEANIIFANKHAVISQIFDITEYKETELKLRTLINATPDIICFKDGQGRWIEANDADLELFSLKNIDYKGKKDSELAQYTHPIYKNAFLTCEQTDESAWSKGTLSRNEEIIPLPDGTTKIFDVIKVPLFNDDGTRKGLVVLGRDITDLKNIQNKLERQLKFSQTINKIAEKIIAEDDRKKIFKYIVDIIRDILNIDQCKVFRVNLKERKIIPIAAKIEYSDVNASFYEEVFSLDNFRLSCEFLTSKHNFLISHLDDVNEILLKEESHKIVHIYYKIKSLLWYVISKDNDGFYFLVLNNIRDFHRWEEDELNFISSVCKLLEILFMKIRIIEEREQSIESIKNLATIIYQSINSIVLTDLEGNIEYANPAFENLSGFKIKDVIGKNIFKLYNINPQIKKLIYKKIKNNDYWNGKLQFFRNNGKKVIEEAFIFPIKNTQGKIVNICKISKDITKDIEMEEYLRHLQKMEAIGTLASGIAHDFNNILTVINGYIEIAKTKVEKNTKLYNYLKLIHDAGIKGENLTKQLLAFSRKQIIKPELCDLNQVIVSLFGMLRRLISEDIKIELRVNKSLPLIKADKTQIEQILVNLIVNSRDAIKEKEKFNKDFDKKIIISTDIVEGTELPELFHSSDKFVTIIIHDTGIGMDSITKKRVFEPFFTTKPKGKGTGLGLSTVYGIVKQNKGYIFIDSEYMQGTTIKIYWPTANEFISLENNKINVEESLTGTGTILVIEDDESILELLKEGLEFYGYKVISVSNGNEALNLIKKNFVPDLVITDIIMPEINGKQLYDKIKQIIPDIKIIFISGYPESEISTEDGILYDDIEFIQKPFAIKDILKIIKQLLSKK